MQVSSARKLMIFDTVFWGSRVRWKVWVEDYDNPRWDYFNVERLRNKVPSIICCVPRECLKALGKENNHAVQ